MTQSANIGPIAYAILKKFSRLNDIICIISVLSLGIVAMALAAFFHDTTVMLGREMYSLPLFISSFFMAIIGCTSSLLFLPYLKNFNVKFLASYFIGEGLSGVIPSTIALIQGIGTTQCNLEPLFTPTLYFLLIAFVLLISLCGFLLLHYQNLVHHRNKDTVIDLSDKIFLDLETREEIICEKRLTKFRIIYLYVLLGVLCFFGNGFLPAIQTYSCLPYGNMAYHLTVTLATVSNPLACVIYVWVHSKDSWKIIDLLSIVTVGLVGFIIFLAVLSPNPPWKEAKMGVFVLVTAWVMIAGLIAYVKLAIASIIKENGDGQCGLGSVGAVMQAGSAIGGLFAFVLIYFAKVFQEHSSAC